MAESDPVRARWRRSGRSPLFVAACAILGALIAAGVLADLVAPYSPTAVDAPQVFHENTLNVQLEALGRLCRRPWGTLESG